MASEYLSSGSPRCRALLVAAILSHWPLQHPALADTLSAVITEVDGSVTAVTEASEGEIHRVYRRDVLNEGTGIRVPSGGRLGLVCSTDDWVELTGPLEWQLTTEQCEAGRKLPGTYRGVAPSGARARTKGAVLVAERPIQKTDGEATVLSPRQTALRDPRPDLRWCLVPGAVEYEIDLTGLAGRKRVTASEAHCQTDQDCVTGGACMLRFPEEHPGLESARTYAINVGYRKGPGERLIMGDTAQELQLLSPEEIRRVDESLAAIQALPMGEAARALLEAGILAEHRLVGEAIGAYRRASSEEGCGPDAYLGLGDLYLDSGLYFLALQSYKAALVKSEGAAAQASALFGMGRLFAARGVYKTALKHLRRAADLYGEAGLIPEREAAARAVADVSSKL